MDQQLFESVDQYIASLFAYEDEVLQSTLKSIEEAGMPSISISPNQGKFLQLLARLCKAERILEIGTLAGYSTIWMARALPPDGRLISLEYDPLHAEVAKKNIQRAGLSNQVEIRTGKGIDLLKEMVKKGEEPFDMIFIDADKQSYKEYLDWSLRLAHPGTLLLADNVVREGKVLDAGSSDEMVQGAIKFNAALAASPAVDASIFQTVGTKEHDGMAIAIVR
ncbi:MAG TPA: O-methyltransferase [Chitinophagaceae bacterium]|nr:O-methyltransferase [Chitinophagaceae bacterium]